MKKQTILIIASGAREHALGWKLSQSPKVGKIYFAPGTPGTEGIGESTGIAATDFDALTQFAIDNKIDLTVAAPDDILAAGVVDTFQKKNLRIFGPTQKASQIEASKAFAKKLMREEKIPTAKYETFTDFQKAKKYISHHSLPIVIKASGLALGKGVVIAHSLAEAEKTLEDIMVRKVFGNAGSEVVIEEFMQGQEVSIHAFSDGEYVSIFPASRDHKQIFDGNIGPNTGGMGTVAPLPDITERQLEEIKNKIVLPAIRGLKKRGAPFVGCLYPGLMMTKDGPKVVEFNCRFGDPEIESYVRLLETDLFDILNACINGTLDKQKITWSNKSACTIALASATYPEGSHKGDIINGLEKIKDKDIVVFHFATKKENNNLVTNGGRVLAVTATGKNLDEALDKAYSVIDEKGIHFDGMQYRRDIGRIKGIVIANEANRSAKSRRLQIFSKVFDTRADVRKKKLQQENKKINDIVIADVYTIDKVFTNSEIEKIASSLSNPVTQMTSVRPKKDFAFAIEIGYLPGVTDNIASTAKETITDLLKTTFADNENVYTSQVSFLCGAITRHDAEVIAATLYNPLIERMSLKSFEEFQKDGGMDLIVPKVQLQHTPQIMKVNLNVSDEELIKIGKLGIENADGTRRGPLALDLHFMKTIQAYFKKLGREPYDIELESIAQTWSEHCKHTIFANPIDDMKDGLYKTYIKGATEIIRKKKGKKDFCISVFSDNSGGIAFDENYMVTHKVETHNSPSALDPFGGAITGIVGVNRDALGFGLGAKPVANFYGFCLADPRVDIPLYKTKDKSQKMLSSERIMEGVVAGINAGGNQSGIPTPLGFVYFDERYRGKPLVFAGTVGLIPRKIKGKLSHIKKAEPGDAIVIIGGRVGKDGIHGATFSSEALSSGSPATAVQIGDPITQKKLSDVIVKEARDMLLYNSITDNGAGGLSCSVAEMAKESDGCVVNLETVPLKYPGLDPWEIWISESQERMTLAVPQKNLKKFLDLMKRRDVEATVIGEFTDNKKCVVNYNKETIMDMDLEFLHNGLPQRKQITKHFNNTMEQQSHKIPLAKNLNRSLTDMLKRLNITSFEFITQQYDHIVQGNLVLGPLQGRGRINAETSVIRPVLDSQKGVILSQGMYPTYSDLDSYHMAAASIDTAVRNAIAAGANPDYLSLLDNFCWCSSDEPERLGQLKAAVKACYDLAVAYETPYISGKDSMFNDFKGFDKNGKPIKISIPPTLLISSFGVVDDVTKVVSLDVKNSGDIVYLLGETKEELGGSEYFAMHDQTNTHVPTVDAEKNKKLYAAVYNTIQQDLIASSISLTRGGLGVALAKTAIGGMLGIDIDLKKISGKVTRDDFALYSESEGRILVTVAKENKEAFEKIMKGNEFAVIGQVTKEPKITIKGLSSNTIIDVTLKQATDAYRETLKNY